MAESQAGPSGKYSQLGQQGVLEEGWLIPREELALVVELFYQGVGGVTILPGGKMVVLWLCLCEGLPGAASSMALPCPGTHRLDHCKLHLPKFVLLHPRLLHHHSTTLLGFLGRRREILSCHSSSGPGRYIPRPSLPPLTVLGGCVGGGGGAAHLHDEVTVLHLKGDVLHPITMLHQVLPHLCPEQEQSQA